jgi:transposase
VIHYAKEMHLSPARIAKRMKIALSTVQDLLQKYSQTGSVRDRPGRGRKRTLTADDEQRIVRKAKKEECAPEITRELKAESGIVIGVDVVRQVIKKHGLQFLLKETVQELSDRNKEKRLAYAQAMKKQDWKKVLFSDEKTFYVGAMTKRAWQVPGKRKKHVVKRYPQKINVWGAAGTYMKSKLYFFKKNMNAPLYQKVIKSRLRNDRISLAPNTPPRLPATYQFLQDNATWHTTKDSMVEVQERVGDRIIAHPAESPDLNIMEDIWSYLDRKVKARNIKTVVGLKQQLTRAWEQMPWSVIRNSVGSMRARLAECEKLQGGRTHY